jgi:hypothetical protein
LKASLCGALERHAVGLAAGGAVLHEGRIEAAEPLPFGIAGDQLLEGHDGVLFDQGEHVHRQDHRELGRVAAFDRRQHLGDGVLIAAGVDRVDLHARGLGDVLGGQRVDGLGRLAADGDGKEELQVDLGLGAVNGPQHQSGRQAGGEEFRFQLHV